MCLAGALVASWSLTQEVTGSNILMTKVLFTEFSENIWGKLNWPISQEMILCRPLYDTSMMPGCLQSTHIWKMVHYG